MALTEQEQEKLLRAAGWYHDDQCDPEDGYWLIDDYCFEDVVDTAEALKHPITTVALLEIVAQHGNSVMSDATIHRLQDNGHWTVGWQDEASLVSAPTLPEAIRKAALEVMDE
ncbi:MAG: hypothetical protein AAF578_00230 [Pseudomonadota bacterium]